MSNNNKKFDKLFCIIEYLIIGICLISAGVLLYVANYNKDKTPVKIEYISSYSYDEQNVSLVNINTASLDELQTLDLIGESKAQNIIDYREKNGGFKTISDIMNVEGIGEGIYEKIKDRITVK